MTMGISRWLGGGDDPARQQAGQLTDERAIERYRYMLRTAPPETIEQAHAEGFAQLNDRQRRMVLDELRQATPESERMAAGSDDPRTLARLATRAELRQPGTMERLFGGSAGPGLGGLLAGSFFGSLAGTVIGSMIAREFLAHAADREAMADTEPDDDLASEDTGGDTGEQLAGDFDDDMGGGDLDIDV
jgi:hypothetical protein